MKKYIIVDKVKLLKNCVYQVEADTEAEALDKHLFAESTLVSEEIIESLVYDVEVTMIVITDYEPDVE